MTTAGRMPVIFTADKVKTCQEAAARHGEGARVGSRGTFRGSLEGPVAVALPARGSRAGIFSALAGVFGP